MRNQPPFPPDAAEAFRIQGDFLRAEPYGNGHINQTYAVCFNQAGTRVRYIFQKINRHVFPDTPGLMRNIARVTGHLKRKLVERGAEEPSRKTLTLVPTRTGEAFHSTAQGEHWRAYLFIENADSHDVVQTPEQAGEAARAFGRFMRDLADLPPPALHVTIPDFHDTPKRLLALKNAAAENPMNRLAECRSDMETVERLAPLAGALVDGMNAGAIPRRVTHNDTKLNNVMLDTDSGRGLCVIDLDTVMPGSALFDFGDLVRTSTGRHAEDTRNLDEVRVDRALLRAVIRGYLEGAGEALTPAEIEKMPLAGVIISFEIGVRFLTDYLQGDRYFAIHAPDDNLARARVQFAKAADLHRHLETWNRMIREFAGSSSPEIPETAKRP